MEPWNANTKEKKAVNFIVLHRNCKLMTKHQDLLLVLPGSRGCGWGGGCGCGCGGDGDESWWLWC
jgi:hypothetical protein